MINRDRDGAYLASMFESLKLFAHYLYLSETDKRDELERQIDINNADPSRHPNEMLFGAAIVLGWMFHQELGRSCAPLFKGHPMTRAFGQYVELAEQHKLDELHRIIEKNTTVPENHPSKLVYHVALTLGSVWTKTTGRSLVGVFRKAAARWEESPDEMIGRLFA